MAVAFRRTNQLHYHYNSPRPLHIGHSTSFFTEILPRRPQRGQGCLFCALRAVFFVRGPHQPSNVCSVSFSSTSVMTIPVPSHRSQSSRTVTVTVPFPLHLKHLRGCFSGFDGFPAVVNAWVSFTGALACAAGLIVNSSSNTVPDLSLRLQSDVQSHLANDVQVIPSSHRTANCSGESPSPLLA